MHENDNSDRDEDSTENAKRIYTYEWFLMATKKLVIFVILVLFLLMVFLV